MTQQVKALLFVIFVKLALFHVTSFFLPSPPSPLSSFLPPLTPFIHSLLFIVIMITMIDVLFTCQSLCQFISCLFPLSLSLSTHLATAFLVIYYHYIIRC